MPLVVAIVAAAMITIGLRGQSGAATTLLASELIGPNSFIQWFLAIVILGMIGYWRPARPVADGLLGLVLLGLFLSKGVGFVGNLEAAFQNTKPAPAKMGTASPGSGAATVNGVVASDMLNAANANNPLTPLIDGATSGINGFLNPSNPLTPMQPFFSGQTPAAIY